MTNVQIDPVFHVTWTDKGEVYEAYHLRLAPALLDYQARIDKGSDVVQLDKWDMEHGSTYTTVRRFDRSAESNLDRAHAA